MSLPIRFHRAAPFSERRLCAVCEAPFDAASPAALTCSPRCADLRSARRRAAVAAPVLRQDAEPDISWTVAAQYDAWRRHHASCPTCGAEDYFQPGAPRIVGPGELADHVCRDRAGREVRLVDYADPAVLCTAGRQLFQAWVSGAMRGITWGTAK